MLQRTQLTLLTAAMVRMERFAYDDAPRVVIWEMTKACALACRHCRAEALPLRASDELTTAEAMALVDALVACGSPVFILSGGDPFMRADIYKIVEYAANRGLRVAIAPSATGRLTLSAMMRIARAGCKRISLSLDAQDAQTHDRFRGVRGCFDRTIDAMYFANAAGLEVQINTTVSRFNHRRVAEIADMLSIGPLWELKVAVWDAFFLVPVGRAQRDEVLDAGETEAVFAQLHEISEEVPFAIKTTEAPHYRRFLAQRAPASAPRGAGIGDGRGFAFVSHCGDVYPSGFLPLAIGNVRSARLIDLYRDDPTMRRLRNPDSFRGKCGVCEFRTICGGSRARAYAMTGDAFAADPTCTYVPAALRN